MTTEQARAIRTAVLDWVHAEHDEQSARSVTSLARRAGVHPSLIQHIIDGRKRPSFRTIAAVRDVPGTQEIQDAMLRAIGIHPIADRLNRAINADANGDTFADDVSDYLDSVGY